jgi:cation:H+ antiporter
MGTDLLLLVFALAALLGGGDALVRGASALARRLGVSSMVIGLTVVAFGTSAPELAVSVSAAAGGSNAIAFGNVVGSNIANVALILGLAALVTPLAVDSTIVTREIPMMILASAAVAAFALDEALDGAASGVIARSEGVGLLLFFSVFLYYTVAGNLFGRRGDPLLEEARDEAPGGKLPLWGAAALVLGGLAGLSFGGHLLVESATAIARALGVGEVVIGITVVAVGTSLPELATSLLAARRGEADIAVGNVVGSNIFNALFVLGTAAVVRPVEVVAGGDLDLAVMGALAVVLLPMAISGGRRISRAEGGVLVAAYAGYVLWQVNR